MACKRARIPGRWIGTTNWARCNKPVLMAWVVGLSSARPTAVSVWAFMWTTFVHDGPQDLSGSAQRQRTHSPRRVWDFVASKFGSTKRSMWESCISGTQN